jgi:DNA topoisomerase-2
MQSKSWRWMAGNMMLFDADGKIRRFGSPEEIIEAFAPLRLEFYHKRKAHLLQVWNVC